MHKIFSFSDPCLVLLRGNIVLSGNSCECTVILYPLELGERLELGIVRFQRGRHHTFKHFDPTPKLQMYGVNLLADPILQFDSRRRQSNFRSIPTLGDG